MPIMVTFPEKTDTGRERRKFAVAGNKTDLSGTTRRVYRYIYRQGPVRLNKIQRDLNLSSSSVADYHVQKLMQMRLIREEGSGDGAVGYVAEKAVFEAMVRIRRTVIPLWTTATSFFAASIVVLLTILRPDAVTATYVFSVLVASVALLISAYQTIRSIGRDAI